MDRNIQDVKKLYNPNKTLLIKENENIYQKINVMIGKEVVLPTILVFKNKELFEFL
jgi:hypothetical protein